MNVFVDTNVLLDVLGKREPFYADSAAVWTLAEQGQVRGLISALSFSNVYYIVRRLKDRRAASKAMVLLRDTFAAVTCDDQILQQSIDSTLDDFEDAIQYFSALRAEAACLISRNPAHFPRDSLSILTPADFLAAYSHART